MPIHIYRSPVSESAYVRCDGVVSLDDMQQQFAEFLADAPRESPYRIVVDLTSVRDIDLSFRDVQNFVPTLVRTTKSSAHAYAFSIVSPDMQTRALVKVFQILTQAVPRVSVTLHTTVASALSALSMTDSDIRRVA
ncbi:hypothetical protein [Maritimibacter sp. UBA3975]|uniref:hypothetical protein n=1 Tax=Maritimibacter sp. UBA3975 TaxID=1946833 RepID=UPI000C0B1983|nr:hypothetical protein [Maritimibacter sp. UBA3975]MAM61188.1 hypothetical protein [Maritimibacter sp.]|tara:strand:+ start:10705 stop:11112 length:408 start_codon:yes stop_codon:yes gene_type:complete